MMELRNDLVCEAFEKKDDTKLKEQIQDFTISPPTGNEIVIILIINPKKRKSKN